MMRTTLAVLMTAMTAAATGAEPGPLAFRPADEEGYVAFDTGLLRGKVRLDGRHQGISSIVHAPTEMELAKSVGLLSYYRVFSAGKRYGHSARDWPLKTRLSDDGALEIVFPPHEEHPLEMTGTFRWHAPDTLDLETTVTPQVPDAVHGSLPLLLPRRGFRGAGLPPAQPLRQRRRHPPSSGPIGAS